jgi:hypothetical protein
MQTMANRVNMQHKISQNLIKSDGQSSIGAMRHYQMQQQNSSLGDFSKTGYLLSQGGTANASENEGGSDGEEDWERLVIDFVSERDLFIQKHKRKNRLILSLNNPNEALNVVEISQLSLKDFMKSNRISPKVFSGPPHQQKEELLRNPMNKRQYYL